MNSKIDPPLADDSPPAPTLRRDSATISKRPRRRRGRIAAAAEHRAAAPTIKIAPRSPPEAGRRAASAVAKAMADKVSNFC